MAPMEEQWKFLAVVAYTNFSNKVTKPDYCMTTLKLRDLYAQIGCNSYIQATLLPITTPTNLLDLTQYYN